MHSVQEEIQLQKTRGVLLVLTGPTGVGKDAVANKILADNPSAIRVTTTTTREKRLGESEGHPYHFVSREKFEQMIAKAELFEWVEFRQEMYGTTKKELEKALSSGHDIIWVIDVKGTKNIKEKVKKITNRCVFVFLGATSLKVLHERVREDPNSIASKRWNEALATWEIAQFEDCGYLVVNENGALEAAVAQVRAIVEAKRCEILPD